MPDRVISVPQATQIATRIKNKFDNVNGRLDQQGNNIVQLDNGKVSLYPDTSAWYRGYFRSTGEFTPNTTNAAPTNTPFVVNAGYTLYIYPNGLSVSLRQFTKSGDTYTQVSVKTYTEDASVTFYADTYISIHVTKPNNTTLTLAEVTTKLWIISNIQHQIDGLSASTNDINKLSNFVREAHYAYEIDFVSGARAMNNPSVVTPSTTKCTTATLITLEAGDTINISGDVTGLKYALAASDYDSGWKYGEFSYTSQNGGSYFVNVAKTSDANISPAEVTLQITVKPYSSWIYETVDNVVLTKRNLFGEKISIPYELGSVTYKNNEAWVYSNANNMVRTPQNGLVHLYKGTTVGLTDYTDARYYIGWIRPDGTSTFSPGWKTSDFLVTEEGYYSLLVSNLTPTAQSSAEVLGSLISIKAMDIVSDVFDSKSHDGKSHNNELNINPYILNSKFIAHRGCDSQYAPENTIPGFKWAIDSGYKILEYDVRFTSDGVPVLIHDETINRTARNQDGTEISTDIYVANSSYEELLNYDFGIWRGSSFAGTKIPTLEEFLIFIKKYGCCGDTDWTTLGSNITPSQIETFMSTVKKTGMMGSVMITSNISVIRNLLLEYPNIMVCVANQGNPLSTLNDCAVAMASARMAIVSLQYPYAEKSWHEYAHNLGLYTKSFTLSSNGRIKTSLEFSPDLMIVGSLKRDEIVID